MALQQDRKAFGRALEQALRDGGHTHIGFGETLAGHLRRDRPFNQTTITRWVSGENAPDPEVTFGIEELLAMPAGTLSRFLGYLPADAVDAPVSVPAAVEADVGLTAMGRRVVLKVYEELVADGSDGSDA